MGSSIRSATEAGARGLALLLCVGLALGPLSAHAASADETKARALYQDGMKAYDVGDFEGALKLYSDAYKLTPLPGFLFNIAQCHRQLANYERAAFFYGRFIDTSKPKASNMEMATQLLGEMKTRQAEKQAAEQKKKADDEARAAEEARKAEDARKAEEAKKAQDAPKVTTLTPAPVDLPPPPPPPAPEEAPVYKKGWFWTVIGVVVVGAAVGTTVGVLASQPPQAMARKTDLTPDLGSH